MLSIRKLQQLLNNQRGQSLVETALLFGFVLAIVVGVNWDSFKESMGVPYQNMAKYVGMKTSSTNPVDVSAYATMSTSELKQVDNEVRLEEDIKTLKKLGGKFIGLTMAQLKDIFAVDNNNEGLLTGTTKFTVDNKSVPRGVIVFDYSIANTGDDGNDLSIKLRANKQGSVSNRESMQWMMGEGHYDTSSSPKVEEYISNRVFYSDEAIEKSPFEGITKEQSATLRAYFSFGDDGKVNKVTFNMARSYEKGSNNWERMKCDDLWGIEVTAADVPR